MKRLGILGSTQGTSMIPILDAISSKNLAATVAVVISNKKASGILAHARNYQLPAVAVETKDRFQAEQEILACLKRHEVESVILIGWMRILSSNFVKVWQNKIINVHPSLLPAFKGGMNLDIHRAVLASGCMETGCTVHRVTDIVDGGEILIQKKCAVFKEDTPEILKKRVQTLEGEALIEVIREKL